MVRGVLLGRRCQFHRTSRAGWFIAVWFPVALMLLAIWRESTDGFSSTHTGALLRPITESIFGRLSDAHWDAAHHVLRKTGHFVGYGLLGVAWLRAWLLTWSFPLRRRPAGEWRSIAWKMALCCTCVVASLDELHQTWIPSRTGLATDVILDTIGATVLTGMVMTFLASSSIQDRI